MRLLDSIKLEGKESAKGHFPMIKAYYTPSNYWLIVQPDSIGKNWMARTNDVDFFLNVVEARCKWTNIKQAQADLDAIAHDYNLEVVPEHELKREYPHRRVK